jgi:starch phosphorylase
MRANPYSLYLPPLLSGLRELATNLRWSWHEPTQTLFRDLNPSAWDEASHSPLRQLASVSPQYLDVLADDSHFVGRVQAAVDDLRAYLTEPRWFQEEYPDSSLKVAYFSPEFGISEALPQYSGGLGVLAGDHLKTASDLGVPLVAVGLFYQVGYFKQILQWNRQEERYPLQDPDRLGLELCDQTVSFKIGDEHVTAQIWLAKVGRVKLYLLDTTHEANDSGLRGITDRLYGGGSEHRLLQEIVLGIGGVKALRVLGETVQVYHSNEGHAGFLGLERIRELVMDHNAAFADAVEQVRPATVFTTHTPVAAGIDQFSRDLMETYFSEFADDCGISMDEFMAIGQLPGAWPRTDFNMAFLGLRLARYANGVSALHGDVSRKMFASLYDMSPEDTPIGHVTNGVHAQTWTPQPMARLFNEHVGQYWHMAEAEPWKGVYAISDDELWDTRNAARAQLVEFVRKHEQAELLSVGSQDTEWCLTMLDPTILTIGFARRAATYKRLDLLLSQPERLERLLLHPDRPVQFVFAGKAHPNDQQGKDLIERVTHFALQHHVRHRMVFVPDYTMGVARAILDADVWLNTPERPREASGTSGEKSVYHGGLQLSVNDGWWDEMAQHGINGWVVPEGDTWDDTANNMFELIENELVESFYVRNERGVPLAWTRLIKGSLATLGWRVSSARMLRDYVASLYLPALQGASVPSLR